MLVLAALEVSKIKFHRWFGRPPVARVSHTFFFNLQIFFFRDGFCEQMRKHCINLLRPFHGIHFKVRKKKFTFPKPEVYAEQENVSRHPVTGALYIFYYECAPLDIYFKNGAQARTKWPNGTQVKSSPACIEGGWMKLIEVVSRWKRAFNGESDSEEDFKRTLDYWQ